MLSISKISSTKTSALADYFERTAGPSDYYESGGEPPGRWEGKAAADLGLEGELKEGELEEIMSGFNPKTGGSLVKNAGDPGRAAGWDCTFSAPKSVSAVWAISDRNTQMEIQRAHDAATQKAMAYLEKEACFGRRGHAGVVHEQVQGIVYASFQHSTSRNGDPQLHTHCIVMNAAERPDGTWGGIDLDTRHKMFSGALYRLELAENLRQMGYGIERQGDSFRIQGVPENLTDTWSSRHQEIMNAMQEKGVTSYEASKAISIETRAEKGTIDRQASMAEWREVGKAHGFSPDEARSIKQEGPAMPRESSGLDQILSGMHEHESTFSKLQLATEIAKESVGSGLRSEQVQELTNDALKHDSVVTLKSSNEVTRFATKEMIEIERHMVETAKQLDQSNSHQVNGQMESLPNWNTLTDEQREAVTHITVESGAIALVEGQAGTGKSHMLDVAREAWERAGFEVRGAALAGKAAEGLQNAAHIESQTIHSLISELESGKTTLHDNTVLVVDEAGLVGSKRMDELVTKCQESGAKLVLVGDSKQLQAIDAGGAFKALANEFDKAELSKSQRQIHEADRETAQAFREGRAADGLRSLEERGRLHIEGSAQQAKCEAANAYARDIAEGKDSIILAATKADVREMNQYARVELKDRGLVGKEDVSLRTTTGIRNFSEGERIVFTKNDKTIDVKNGTLATINQVSESQVCATTKDGRVITFDPHQKQSFDHAYALTVHKAQGTTVDTAHVYTSELSNREWSYVSMTRAREQTQVYASKDLAEIKKYEQSSTLERTMERSLEKDTTLDYQPVYKEKGISPVEKEKDAGVSVNPKGENTIGDNQGKDKTNSGHQPEKGKGADFSGPSNGI